MKEDIIKYQMEERQRQYNTENILNSLNKIEKSIFYFSKKLENSRELSLEILKKLKEIESKFEKIL